VDKIPCKAEFGSFWERATKYEANQVHFEKLWDLRSPAGYMSKYITKALHSGYHDRERRIGYSQNFPKLPWNLEPKTGIFLSYDPRHEPDLSLNIEATKAFETSEQEFKRLTSRRKL
jgi:hypothetical protein